MSEIETTKIERTQYRRWNQRWSAKRRLNEYSWLVAYGTTRRSAIRNLKRKETA